MAQFNDNETGLAIRNKINQSIEKTDHITVTGPVNLDAVGDTSTVYYVDSVNGQDSFSGLSAAQPFRTLTKATSVWKSGNTLRLIGNSFWRETLKGADSDLFQDITVESWGGGTRPVISGRDLVTGFTLKSGRVYQATVEIHEDGFQNGCYPSIFEDGYRLDEILIGDPGVSSEATAIAAVEAMPGSFYFAGPGSRSTGWSAGNKAYYVHPTGSSNPLSNSKSYESATRLFSMEGWRGTIRGITLVSGFHHDGVSNARMVDCVVLDPSRHGSLGPWQHENTYIAGGNHRYTSSGLFHNAPAGGSPDLAWIGCIGVGHRRENHDNWTGVAFFTHISGPVGHTRDKQWLIDCEAHNVRTAIEFTGVGEIEVVNFKARDFQKLIDVENSAYINGLDARGYIPDHNQRVIWVASNSYLSMRAVYVEVPTGQMIYGASGIGDLYLRDFTFIQNTKGAGGGETRAIQTPGNESSGIISMKRGWFIASGPTGFTDGFMQTKDTSSFVMDEVMVIGVTSKDAPFLSGPVVKLAVGDKRTSELTTGRVLTMPTVDKAFARGDSGKLMPRLGAWTPNSTIFSGAASPYFSNGNRSICAVGDNISTGSYQRGISPVSFEPTEFLNGVAHLNSGNGVYIAVGENGYTVVSSNWDNDWAAKDSKTSAHLRGAGASTQFTSAIVVAVGDGGVITRSTNSGDTWALVASNTTDDLFAVATDNGDNWIAVGKDGRVCISGDNGATWTPKTQGSEDLYACAYSKTMGGFVIGGNDGVLYTTMDNGTGFTKRETATRNRFVGFAEYEEADQIVGALYQTQDDPMQIITSADGVKWKGAVADLPFQIRGITGPTLLPFSGQSFMVVGESQSVAYSHSGSGDWGIILTGDRDPAQMHDHLTIDDVIGRSMTRKLTKHHPQD